MESGRKSMAKSILQDEKRCFLCGSYLDLEEHHVFGGVANRRLSEKYGLKVHLCAFCHRGTEGVHSSYEANKKLKQIAQEAFEQKYSHEEWMRIFRKNYL